MNNQAWEIMKGQMDFLYNAGYNAAKEVNEDIREEDAPGADDDKGFDELAVDEYVESQQLN